MYDDRLDGRISAPEYDRRAEIFEQERAQLQTSVARYERASSSYVEEGIRVLELAHRAVELYERQDVLEQGKLTALVFSNSTWGGRRLHPQFRQPFGIIADAMAESANREAAGGGPDGFSELWLRRRDSNP